MGTGSFISVNVGAKPISSENGLYPLVTFKLLEKEMYILHGPISSAGIDIDWAKSIGKQQFSRIKPLVYCILIKNNIWWHIGLYNNYDEIESILQSTENSNGVFYIPPKVGGDDKKRIGTGFVGITSDTTKAQMLRAIFDSIGFSIKLMLDTVLKDLNKYNISLKSIK